MVALAHHDVVKGRDIQAVLRDAGDVRAANQGHDAQGLGYFAKLDGKLPVGSLETAGQYFGLYLAQTCFDILPVFDHAQIQVLDAVSLGAQRPPERGEPVGDDVRVQAVEAGREVALEGVKADISDPNVTEYHLHVSLPISTPCESYKPLLACKKRRLR